MNIFHITPEKRETPDFPWKAVELFLRCLYNPDLSAGDISVYSFQRLIGFVNLISHYELTQQRFFKLATEALALKVARGHFPASKEYGLWLDLVHL